MSAVPRSELGEIAHGEAPERGPGAGAGGWYCERARPMAGTPLRPGIAARTFFKATCAVRGLRMDGRSGRKRCPELAPLSCPVLFSLGLRPIPHDPVAKPRMCCATWTRR